MSIVTTSGRIVKRKVSGVRPVVKACRAKALAPWAGLIYLPTEMLAVQEANAAAWQAQQDAGLADWRAEQDLAAVAHVARRGGC